jgi:seryl-tRNA synthetase
MIDIKLLEKKHENTSEVSYFDRYRQCLLNRNAEVTALDELMQLNRYRKECIAKAEEQKSLLNKVSQEIAVIKKKGEDASVRIAEMQVLSKEIKEKEQLAADADLKVTNSLLVLPNLCHSSVPIGKSENENIILRTVGSPGKFSFKPLEHNDLGEKLRIIDFDRAGKVSGARFSFLKGAAAKLERALMQFMMDTHSEIHGYTEMIPPFIVNSKSLQGTGNFPKFRDDVFHLQDTDYHLIPTAEVPVTNFYSEEILTEEQLPQKFVAYSPCFRSEAGSHGRDTKGLIRQHQFNKVELMVFAHPNNSYELHEALTSHAEEILKRLEIPYRVAALCTGDISFGAAKCYDLEAWLPGQNTYREISSCSIFEDFQARRANIRFRPSGGGKPQFVHTLNGSGLAVGRSLIAVMENYQQEDGSIRIPKVLQSYMQGLQVIRTP